jgi:hypothetical protein
MILIDQQEAARQIRRNKEYVADCQWLKGYNKACEDNARIIENMKPKIGHWVWNRDTLDWERLHYCSECKKYALRDTDGEDEVLSNFCPNCGADMRGKVND